MSKNKKREIKLLRKQNKYYKRYIAKLENEYLKLKEEMEERTKRKIKNIEFVKTIFDKLFFKLILITSLAFIEFLVIAFLAWRV